MARTTRPMYRIKAEHPRRPGQPLRVTDKAGNLIGVSGEICRDDLAPELLASMITNGYVELVTPDAKGGQ